MRGMRCFGLALVLTLTAVLLAAQQDGSRGRCFLDDFDRPQLDSRWDWVREDETHWSLSARAGFLEVVTQSGGILEDSNDARNLLLTPAPAGDFEIETRVEFTPGENFQIAGVIVYKDDDNFLMLGRAFCGAEPPLCAGNGIYLDFEVDGVHILPSFAKDVGYYTSAYLRVARMGTLFSAYCSFDGALWDLIGEWEWEPEGALYAGLAAQNSNEGAEEIPADFDYFSLATPECGGELGMSYYRIELASRTFIPFPGLDGVLVDLLSDTARPSLHSLVQLYRLPTPEEWDVLAGRGVSLLSYLGGSAYWASVSASADLHSAAGVPLIRWMGAILPEDRISSEFQAGDLPDWAINSDGSIKVIVRFFSDTPADEAREVLEQYHAGDPRLISDSNQWEINLHPDRIQELATEDTIQRIQLGPIPFQPTNSIRRSDLNADVAQAASISGNTIRYAGLSGSGVTIAICDTGVDPQHNDFSGRLVRQYGSFPRPKWNDCGTTHGTAVAGAAAGSGIQSDESDDDGIGNGGAAFEYRGFAPEADIAAYGHFFGDADDYSSAITDLSVSVSNHSYVMSYAIYDGVAHSLDEIVRGDASWNSKSIPARPVVCTAANQGVWTRDTNSDGVVDSPQYDDEEGYFSIYAPAKNPICVGAVDPGTGALSSYSSRGPTFDGRIKPDVMATGCDLAPQGRTTTHTVNNAGNGYTTCCGTSLAAPCVTGTIALMVEQCRQTYGTSAGFPLPSTFKAILINTARDLVHFPGQNVADFGIYNAYSWNCPDTGAPVIYHEGPDYATGYGLIDTARAASAVRERTFLEDSVSPSDVQDEFDVFVGVGRDELRFTLAWDDEPGDDTTAETAIKLVNDLDLMLIEPDGTTIHRPWVLAQVNCTANPGDGAFDPIATANITAATRGVDRRNNVEQVVVDNPVQGTWTVRVARHVLPNNNTQTYSLAGDFRLLHVLSPSSSSPIDVGDKNSPTKLLIRLTAKSPHQTTYAAMTDVDMSDFEVEVGGKSAPNLSGFAVGEQYWLLVDPPTQISNDYYDLTVRWIGRNTVTVSDAVYYLKEGHTNTALVIDESGSMADYGKMAAAQNAARLFIDQRPLGEWTAVIGFSTTATCYIQSSLVNENVRTTVKNSITSLAPDALTAIGLGLLEGQSQIDLHGDPNDKPVMVLLSDGMENVQPYWNSSTVRDKIVSSGTDVHTVAVGPAGAGHHSLLQKIADQTGGDFIPTEEHTPGPPEFPATLGNRFADIYKGIAEELNHEQRFWEARGELQVTEALGYEVLVEEGLGQATFTVNWAESSGLMDLRLTRPDGSSVAVADMDVDSYRTDATHRQYVINSPAGGYWYVVIERFPSIVPSTGKLEFISFGSAMSPITLHVFVPLAQEAFEVHKPVPIVAVLADRQPICSGSATVSVAIKAPEGGLDAPSLELFDDGQHGDGSKGDGIYGNYYTGVHVGGSYQVKCYVDGVSNQGIAFVRWKMASFFVPVDDADVCQPCESLYDKLIDIDSSGTLVPELAVSWEIAENGMSLRLHLREGVTFHNGEVFSAEAVVLNATENVTLLEKTDRVPLIDHEFVADIVAIDDSTVDIYLTVPRLDELFSLLVGETGMIASPVAVRELGIGHGLDPVGSGRFRLAEYIPGEQIALERYPDYWRALNELEGIIYLFDLDVPTHSALLAAGELDVVSGPAGHEAAYDIFAADPTLVTCRTSRTYQVWRSAILQLDCYPDGALRFDSIQNHQGYLRIGVE